MTSAACAARISTRFIAHAPPRKAFARPIHDYGPDHANGVVVDEYLPAHFELTDIRHHRIVKITQPSERLLRITVDGLHKGSSVFPSISGHFTRAEQGPDAGNYAALRLDKYYSYQDPNKKPNADSILMKVVR
jgi:hypothetical protein